MYFSVVFITTDFFFIGFFRYEYLPEKTRFRKKHVCLKIQYMKKKDRLTFILLGIFFGSLGVYNFYAGYTVKGVVQLLVTILTFGILGFVSALIALMEVYFVTCDASGQPFAKYGETREIKVTSDPDVV